jgi:hypothetical protein
MQNKNLAIKLLVGIIAVLVIAVGHFFWQNYVTSHSQNTPENCGFNGERCFPSDTSKNIADLVSFSITPGQKVSGQMMVTGTLKNTYFFEASTPVKVLDVNKKVLVAYGAHATTDWMTAGPVDFTATIDFSTLTKGPAYIAIENDNPGGEPAHLKQILIPIVIE